MAPWSHPASVVDACNDKAADIMSRSLRIALAQYDFPVGDVAGNSARIIELAQIARDEYGADVVLFPELAVSGYPPEDLLLRPSFLRGCEQAIAHIAAQVQGIVAVVGWPQSADAGPAGLRGPVVRRAAGRDRGRGRRTGAGGQCLAL